jgi:hypothetical protein
MSIVYRLQLGKPEGLIVPLFLIKGDSLLTARSLAGIYIPEELGKLYMIQPILQKVKY